MFDPDAVLEGLEALPRDGQDLGILIRPQEAKAREALEQEC